VRTSALALAALCPLLASLVHCGGAVGDAAPPPAPALPPVPPPAAPADHVALDVYVDGTPVGEESWAITALPDGSTSIAFDATLDEKGAKLTGTGTLAVAPDMTTRGATIALTTPDGNVKGELSGTGAAMTLKLTRGGESRDVQAEEASNLFLPQPFVVGFAKLCPALAAKKTGLVEFPGSALKVLSDRELPAVGVTAFTVERGALGRTVVGCDKGDFIAAYDPWTGQGAARKGRKPVLDALAAAATRQKPKTPDTLTEEDVTVTVPALGSDVEAKLSCSFMKPVAPPTYKPTKLPAVVFFSGSGPQDRDEDTVGPGGVKLSIFKAMAMALGAQGVASLRCDDRGTGKSTGVFEQATLGTFVRDAEEMVKALRAHAEVDGSRLGVVGHSEGGVVAPVVARADGKLKAVLLMAAPGRPIPEIAVVQQERMLTQAGLSKEQVQKQLDAQGEVLKAIKSGSPLPPTVPPTERARIEAQRAWLKSHFDHDPQQALREMPKTAVLVVQGAKDVQVPAEDAELVRKGLASGKNAGAKVVVYPALNHVFAESHGGSVTEYSDPQAEVDKTFLGDMTAFFVQAFANK
jgi:pimeloyl-ACP methyl ester carboxylesterase